MPSSDPPGDGETRRQSGSVPLAPTTFEVLVVEGPDAGPRALLDASTGKLLVATGPLCELRLTDPTVSRRHASIDLTDLGVLVSDLGSTHGSVPGGAGGVAAPL